MCMTVNVYLNEGVMLDVKANGNSNVAIRRIDSRQLFLNVKEVMIDHLNETYLLRLTKQNKLILTKR
jgi:hemin uptake protein HemP